MTEHDLFMALRVLYPEREYALLPQVSNGTGAHSRRHADAIALSLWPSRGILLHGFEMKCDRRDWRRELENPEKAEEVARFCRFWWIVASGPKVAPVEEVPENWGLLVWSQEKQKLERVKQAACRGDSVPPTWLFVAAILRQAQGIVSPEASLEAARKEGIEKGREELKHTLSYEHEQLRKLRDKVTEFESASGIKVTDSWRNGKDIGRLVGQLLDGGAELYRRSLVSAARELLEALGEGAETERKEPATPRPTRTTPSRQSVPSRRLTEADRAAPAGVGADEVKQ